MINIDPNYVPAKHGDDGFFLCPWCRLWTPFSDGAHDTHGEACSPCCMALHAGIRPTPDPTHLDRRTRLDPEWRERAEQLAQQRAQEAA